MERSVTTQGSAVSDAAMPELGLDLALTLCARLCHDLAGTLGALTGTLDMAAAGQDPDALALAADCARDLSARLRVLRTAWGTDDESPDAAALAAGLPGAERLKLDMSGIAPELDERLRRLLPNLLMVAAEGLPRGGVIAVSGGARSLNLRIDGVRAGWPATLGACLTDPARVRDAAASARHVGIAVTCLLAGTLGVRITVPSETELRAATV